MPKARIEQLDGGSVAGQLITSAAGIVSSLKHNLSAVVDPAIGNDDTEGYAVGSVWANVSTNNIFFCTDAGTGAAVWREVGEALTGTAGGDLAGTYPNPTVKQTSDSFALYDVLSPAQITGDQDNYNPTGLADVTRLRVSSDADRTITGLAGGTQGRILYFHNIGSYILTLAHESASSTAANRFDNPGSYNVRLGPGGTALLIYDEISSRWDTALVNLGGEAVRTYNRGFSIFGNNQVYLQTASAPWVSAAQFTFPGTDNLEVNPDTAVVIGSASSDGSTASYRIYDITNSLAIATVTGTTVNIAEAVIDLGTVSNLPTGQAIFEIQYGQDTGGQARISFMNLFS